MKVDIDSIVVVIVSLLFLVFSGLLRSRKKKPVMKSNLKYKPPSGQAFKGKDLLNDAVTMINDPFAKLEKMFNTPEQTYSQEGESLEEAAMKETGYTEVIPGKKAVSQEVPVKQESQSLEVIVDEVAEYLKEKEISKSALKTEKMFDDGDLTQQEKRIGSIQDQKKKAKIPLFENVDDIKKAVIYSEILNRMEY